MAIKQGLTVFMHIPKTGGTTLQNILSRFYKKANSIDVVHVNTPLRKIAIEHSGQKKTFLIKGHLRLEEVSSIPGNYIFTFLRSPVSRVVSHFNYLKQLPSARHFEYLNRPDTTIESFYLLKEKKDLDNCMTRYLSDSHDCDFGKINEQHFLQAMENLEHKINFFGIQEYFNESLVLLSDELGWPFPVYRKKNVSSTKNKSSASTEKFIEEANHWDSLLYEKAKTIFIEKINRMTASEKRKLSRLNFLSKIASAIPF